MSRYRHLSDSALTHGFDTASSREDAATADLLEYIAEFDERKLYLPAGYPSLLDYCIGKQLRSRDAARKRIHAAHAARRFPVLFDLVRHGQLNLSAVVLLAPCLTPENADDLLAAASYRSKEGIRQLIQQRCAPPGVPTLIESVGPASGSSADPDAADVDPSAPARVEPCAPGRMEVPVARMKVTAPVHLDDEMEGLVSRAQALLGYELRSDDPKEVIRRSLRLLVRQLEKRQSAMRPGAHGSTKLRPSRPRESANPRHIPPDVKSAVWERDGGRCTFVGENGHQCEAAKSIELDHIVPVARGGQATATNLRLRCRAHNQFEAERAFGSEFMQNKRHAARLVAAKARERNVAAEPDAQRDVIPWLRQLGYRTDQARRAAAHCETLGDASLEERVRAALTFLAPPHRRVTDHLATR